MQDSASIQPRTSLSTFGCDSIHLSIRILKPALNVRIKPQRRLEAGRRSRNHHKQVMQMVSNCHAGCKSPSIAARSGPSQQESHSLRFVLSSLKCPRGRWCVECIQAKRAATPNHRRGLRWLLCGQRCATGFMGGRRLGRSGAQPQGDPK